MRFPTLKLSLALTLLTLSILTSPLKAEDKAPELASSPTEKVIYRVKAEGIINPVMSEYIINSIKTAENDGAVAVIIQLDTPGGLDLSMRDIIKSLLASDTPVIVFVGPSGSRAASAGVFIAYAANIAAMAPGTNIGSAHPVAMGGKKMDETMVKKVENDAAAYIKSIAAKRGRNAKWAEKAVRESVNITATEALRLNVIDIVADDVAELIKKLNGKQVDLPSGKRTLDTTGADVKNVEMGLRHSILSAITNPNVAYILMMLGMLGLYFELSNPGSIFPGVVGAICLVLAFYSFQTLPVNYAGVALIALAMIFFFAELQVTSLGMLTLAGLVALTLGSLMLFDSPMPFMRVSLSVILPILFIFSAFFVVIIYFAVRIYKRDPVSGTEGFVGETGTAYTDLNLAGSVFVDGEYWNAESTEPIEKGARIKVLEIDGLKLKVGKARLRGRPE